MVAFEGVIRQAFGGDSEVIWGDSLRVLGDSGVPPAQNHLCRCRIPHVRVLRAACAPSLYNIIKGSTTNLRARPSAFASVALLEF